jgi:hypothetical protein
MQFWDAWAKTLETIGNYREDDRLRAEAEIRNAGDVVKGHFSDAGRAGDWKRVSEYRAYRASQSVWKRFFLLYEPWLWPSYQARMRAYVATTVTLFLVPVMLHWPLLLAHGVYPRTLAEAAEAGFAMSVAVFLIFRFLAAQTERRHLQKASDSEKEYADSIDWRG